MMLATANKPTSSLNTFLGLHRNDFVVMDTTDPADLKMRGYLEIARDSNTGAGPLKYDHIRDVAYYHTNLAGPARINAADISDPESPIELPTDIRPSGGTRGFDIDAERGLLFMVDSSSNVFYIIDISDPLNVPGATYSIFVTQGGQQLQDPWDVAYDPINQVCIVCDANSTGRIGIVDVSNGLSSPPVCTDVLVASGAGGVGDALAVECDPRTQTAYISRAISGGGGYLTSIDYSDTALLAIRDSITVTDWDNMYQMRVVPERDYLIGNCAASASAANFHIFDISDPDNLDQRGAGSNAAIRSVIGSEYDPQSDTVFLIGDKADFTGNLVASFEVLDADTVNHLDTFDIP